MPTTATDLSRNPGELFKISLIWAMDFFPSKDGYFLYLVPNMAHYGWDDLKFYLISFGLIFNSELSHSNSCLIHKK